MKSKRSGRDLPFIKIKSDNVKQAEALISGGLGIILKVEEFRTTPSVQQCFKCQGFLAQGSKLYQKTEMCYVW